MVSDQPGIFSLRFEGLQVADALYRKVPGLFHEVVFDSPGFGGGENFGPVHAVLADR